MRLLNAFFPSLLCSSLDDLYFLVQCFAFTQHLLQIRAMFASTIGRIDPIYGKHAPALRSCRINVEIYQEASLCLTALNRIESVAPNIDSVTMGRVRACLRTLVISV
jgi:hypothetical protein